MTPAETLHTFHCIDGHTCGNPGAAGRGRRPAAAAPTMSERRQDFLADHDWIRRALMFEPRGHDVMSGSILYPPTRADCDIGDPVHRDLRLPADVRPRHDRHGDDGASRTGWSRRGTPGVLTLDAPAGPGHGRVRQRRATMSTSVRITNVPSYLHADAMSDRRARALASSRSTSPMAAISTPSSSRRRISPDWRAMSAGDILRWSPIVRAAVNDATDAVHPEDATHPRRQPHACGPARRATSARMRRNAVFYGDKAIDRSPCGTGTSARMAQLVGQGKAEVGDDFIHESIIGSLFNGRVESDGHRRQCRRHPPQHRRLGAHAWLQHDLRRSARSVRAWFPGRLTPCQSRASI